MTFRLLGLAMLPWLSCSAAATGELAAGDPLPALRGEFLTGQTAVLPQAASGRVALLLLGFSYDSRFAVEAWAKQFRAQFGTDPRVTFYEVPMIGGLSRLGKWFIDRGMRRGTPKADHEHVITVYGGTEPWKRRVAFRDSEAAYLILLDKPGEESELGRAGTHRRRSDECGPPGTSWLNPHTPFLKELSRHGSDAFRSALARESGDAGVSEGQPRLPVDGGQQDSDDGRSGAESPAQPVPLMLVADDAGRGVFVWGRQLIGAAGRDGGLFLFALDPTVMAHAGLVTMGAWGSHARSWCRAVRGLATMCSAPDAGRSVLCGLAMGAALTAKFTAFSCCPWWECCCWWRALGAGRRPGPPPRQVTAPGRIRAPAGADANTRTATGKRARAEPRRGYLRLYALRARGGGVSGDAGGGPGSDRDGIRVPRRDRRYIAGLRLVNVRPRGRLPDLPGRRRGTGLRATLPERTC